MAATDMRAADVINACRAEDIPGPHEVLIPARGVFSGESTARSVSDTRLVNIAPDFISANQLYQMYKRHFRHTVRQTGRTGEV